MTKEIELTQGQVALVDDEDYEELKQHKWCVTKDGNTFYAQRSGYFRENCNKCRVIMHREIMGLSYKDGKQIDHINRDGLDNRRANLRIASQSINMHNRRMNNNNTSGHKGVWWLKRNKKWIAAIMANGKRIHLGLFNNIQDAADARKQGELKYW